MLDKRSVSIRQQLCATSLRDFDSIFSVSNEVWKEEPITFREFVTSKEFMGFPALSERQYGPSDFMFGDDPKTIFDNHNNTGVLCWGKGCVSAETVLEDALTHEKYTIEELYKKNKSIFVNCYDEDTQRSTIEVASVPWISGTGEIYKVETEGGKTINVYKFHKFLTRNGWKKLSELNIGDEILDDTIDIETFNLITEVVNDFRLNHETYTESEVKTYLLSKFSWKNKPEDEKYKNKVIYNKCLCEIMGEAWRSKKFGLQKDKHPLWGTHQSEDSKKRNSESNKKALRDLYKSERGDEVRKKISLKMKGNLNPMYGRPAPVGSGKCDYFKFKNNKGEEYLIQGTCELKFAEFLNDKNIYWQKNFDRFDYVDVKGNNRTYCPDFKLFFEKKIVYIEIKGLEDENVDIKLQAVRDSGKEILIIRQDTFRQYYKNYETPELKFVKIKAITYLRNDNYYDLEVDKYHNYLAQGLYNHNSGKDTITTLLMCYIIYVLLCLRSPQKFLGLPDGEPIDLLNVAVNAQQASGVFFEKFKQRLIRWQWLRDKYPVKFSGSFLGQARIDDILNTVTITQNAAIFPNNIRAISGHSGANSQEGKNILFFVCDEIAGFDETPITNKGMTIFNMMKSSAISRFGNRYKGVALSFTRYEGDAILKLYEQGQSELHWFCDKACTWEVKPEHCFKDYPQKYFEYEGQKIPLEYQSEFKADPENAKTKYMCMPSAISSVFIEKPEKIRACIDINRLPIVSLQDYENDNYVKKAINGYNISRNDIEYLVTIDLGLRSDSAALSIFHTESTDTGLKAVQDLMTGWVPNPEKHLEVSIDDIREFLKEISKHIRINKVLFDQWNSALLIEQLNKLNIPSEEYRLNFADYKHAKEMLYAGRVSLQPNERLQEEFRRLILTRSKRVDHPSDGCFIGDTQIKLLNGTIKTIKELADAGADKEFWIYACKPDGTIVPAKAYNAHVTKTVNLLCKVTLDNNKSFICTPEHLIMLRNGTYVQAKDLVKNDSVMPLRCSYWGKYEILKDNKTNKARATHKMVYKYFNGEYDVNNEVIHHYDINPRNNSPENLVLLTRAEHAERHAFLSELGKKYIRKRIATLKKNNKLHPERVKNLSEKLRNFYKTDKGKYVHSIIMQKAKITRNSKESKLRRLLAAEKCRDIWYKRTYEEQQQILSKGKETFKRNKKLGLHKKISTNDVYWKSPEGRLRRAELAKTQLRDASKIYYEQAKQERHKALDDKLKNKTLDLKHCLSYKNLAQQVGIEERPNHGRLTRALSERYKDIDFKQNLEEVLRENITVDNVAKLFKCNIQTLKYYVRKYNLEYLLNKNVKDYNHKVVSVELINIPNTPVYDITVPEFNNFALASGVFVHNSKDLADTVVGAIKVLLTKKATNNNINMMSGIYIQDNLQSLGGNFIGQEN